MATDLPNPVQPSDPFLDGKRDAAALGACSGNVPLLSKLGYLNTGAQADPLFAIRGGTFTWGFPIGARRVSSVILLGDTEQQSAQAVTSLGSPEFGSCFARTAPRECAADNATCAGLTVGPLATPSLGEGRRAVIIHALVTEARDSLPRLNIVTYTIVQVGTAVGLLSTVTYDGVPFPDAVRIRLASLLAARMKMKGLPVGANEPSQPLQAGQQSGGALSWASDAQSVLPLPAGTIAEWDADNGHIIGYSDPSIAGGPGTTLELQSGQWVPLKPTHQPAVAAETVAYDYASGQLLLLGDALGVQQTWSWDGADWTRQPGSSPAFRTGSAFTYDNAQTHLVLFGGKDRGGQELGDTWVWDGHTWAQLTLAGPTPRAGTVNSAPGPRDHAALAYDAATQGLVLFGGYSDGTANSDTWLLTGSSWRQVSTNRSPLAGSYWMIYMPNSGHAVLLGRDGAGTWQQWTYDERAVTWRQLLSTSTPPLTAFWPVFNPSTQLLALLPSAGTDDLPWTANYYSLAAEPTTPCTTYEVSDKSTEGFQLLVAGASTEKSTDLTLAADGTAAVTYRERNAAGPQVDLGLNLSSGLGLDVSFYAQNVYNVGTEFAFNGADAAQSAVSAANTLHVTGDATKVRPPISDGPDKVYFGGGVEIGGGLTVSAAEGLASASVSGSFTHVAGIVTDLKSHDFSVESETESTTQANLSFVLGWTPSFAGQQKMSEEFDSIGHPQTLTASWAGQADLGYSLGTEIDLENKKPPSGNAVEAPPTNPTNPIEPPKPPNPTNPLEPPKPPNPLEPPKPPNPTNLPSGKPVAGTEDPGGGAEPKKQPESRLVAPAVALDFSTTASHRRILTVQHRWALTGAGGPGLLEHMNDPLDIRAVSWMAANAPSATTILLLNDVKSVKIEAGGSFQFVLKAGYQRGEEIVDSALVSAAYIPPGGAPTPWVACTAAIGRPS
ncbi:MAG: hypothetical protein ABI345_07525 [Jatrophihabitans sp.]